ncbi:hypothetical protein Q8F55_003914 [Vanrija albida]|uniref:Uncharacterized protein n=1 Tax=Vanrija albida TaxID=181172 RepID=A0ABR3Q5A3_9TREE
MYTPATPIDLEHETFPLPLEMIAAWHTERAPTFVTLDWEDAELLGYPREVFASQEVHEAEANHEFSDIIDRLGGQPDAEPLVSAEMPEEAPLLTHLRSPPRTPPSFVSVPDLPTPPPEDAESLDSQTWNTFCKAKSWVADDPEDTPRAPSPLVVTPGPVVPKEEAAEGSDSRDEREVSGELGHTEAKPNGSDPDEQECKPVLGCAGSLDQLQAMYPSSPADGAGCEMEDGPKTSPTPVRFTKLPSPQSRARTCSPTQSEDDVPSSPPTLKKTTAPTSPISPLLTPVEPTHEEGCQRTEGIKRSASEAGPSRTPHLIRTRGHSFPTNALALDGMEVECKVTLVDTRGSANAESVEEAPSASAPAPALARRAPVKRKRADNDLKEVLGLVQASSG